MDRWHEKMKQDEQAELARVREHNATAPARRTKMITDERTPPAAVCGNCGHELTDHATPNDYDPECIGHHDCPCTSFAPTADAAENKANGHDWFHFQDNSYRSCRICMVVERRDKTNKPCKGPVKSRDMEPIAAALSPTDDE